LRNSRTAAAPALKKALKNNEQSEDVHKILTACGQDQKVAERVSRFRGLLRQDSFERPVVVLPGGIYVGQGSARRSTGTHYTPRSLTEPIVQYTLEPLVYRGPAEGLPKEQWQLRSPKEILDLKICDMAMGSGAFLVQVCRYLSERLVEAWEVLEREHPGEVLITPEGGFSHGEPSERLIPKEPAERLAIARRLVADRCIYGVDINPMAVEMAKLSIWLITVDKTRPFTFLDHALKCGDSLLGISQLKQLETFSLDDENAKQVIILSNYDELIRAAIAKRRELEMLPSNDAEQIAVKKALHVEAEERLAQLKLASDLLISAELTESKEQKKDMARAAGHIKVTQYIHEPVAEFRRFAHEQLDGRRTLHWPLEFPEIFDRGGFDAFVGNPPFVGGKRITTGLGTIYRDYLVEYVAAGKRGHADLCAYFFLRALSLLRNPGCAGLLATNTIAQGDTREIGLEQLLESGVVIFRGIQSKPWPGQAALEIAWVWLCKGQWRGECVLDDMPVGKITGQLTALGSVTGIPYRLEANAFKSFVGSYVLGMGFVLQPDEAHGLIKKNACNADVISPYLNGEDVNTRWDQSPSRWVINFYDWPLDRSCEGTWKDASPKERELWLRNGRVPHDYEGRVANDYPDCLDIVERLVKPERTRKNEESEFVLRYPLFLKWWIYADKRPGLYRAIAKLNRVLVIPETTKHCTFTFCAVGPVFSHMTKIITVDDDPSFAVLSSGIHEEWARTYSSTLETRLKYIPTDAFETFPFPLRLAALASIGSRYYEFRRKLMLNRQEGLTKTYNRFNDRSETSVEITQLRTLHVELDYSVAAAYGWNDLGLDHGFHETKQGLRFTIRKSALRIALDRLLALNHQRYDEEVRAGLHDKKAKAGSSKRGSSKNKVEYSTGQGGLYLKTEPLV